MENLKKGDFALFLCYNKTGGNMLIAIDKNTIKSVKKHKNIQYIYLFDNTENIESLLKTKMHCIYYERCSYVDINLTNFEIECLKKAKITDKNYDKLPPFKENKIGIIIPNYNYEHTIKKCLDSIKNQIYKNYEVIFIDDMSTDDSVEIAKTYQDKMNIKIIELKQKRYNGGARNEGYLHLSDDVDYVYYVDSDDWLYDDNVLNKINIKLQSEPDVLFVGLAQFKNNKTSTCYIPDFKDKYEAFKGWSGSCGKVIKKTLATRQECLYNEGTLKEDKNQHCRICFYMNNFVLLKEPVYVWNQSNLKSVTTIREKVFWGTSTIRHYADTLQFALSIKGKDAKIDKMMQERIDLTKKEVDNGGDRQW